MPPTSEWSYVIAAYGLTWIVLAGFGLRLARRLRSAAWPWRRRARRLLRTRDE